MDKLYTIGFSKLLDQTVGFDSAHKYNMFRFKNVDVQGEKMDVFFCHNDKGIFVIAGKYWSGGAHRNACGRWSSGNSYYDIYFRKNFRNKEEGNSFYLRVKRTMAI